MKICVSILLFFSTEIIFAQSSSYPLHIGDYSLFTVSGPEPYHSSRIEGDTLMLNGHRYFHILYDGSSYGSFERQEGEKVYRFNVASQKEFLLYDFSLSAGDTVSSFPNGSDTTDIIFSSYEVKEVFGARRKQWGFSIDYIRHAVDDERFIEITDSIGVTGIDQAVGFSKLRGAFINGRVFGSITSVENTFASSPARIWLRQNYPNPFNPATIIEYELPSERFVSLTIFNQVGQEIASLVNTIQGPGIHDINWIPSNLPSGVYYYRLSAGSIQQTRSLLILR